MFHKSRSRIRCLQALLAGCNLLRVQLSPPNWIIGEWVSDTDNRALFTESNLILSGSDFEQQRVLDEKSSSCYYMIEVEHDDGYKVTYDFQKESAHTLNFSSSRLNISETMYLLD